jgi:hypothetical protein
MMILFLLFVFLFYRLAPEKFHKATHPFGSEKNDDTPKDILVSDVVAPDNSTVHLADSDENYT